MRYTYKELKYQEKAVTSVVDVFAGQHYVDKSTFPMEKKQKGHLAFQTEGFGNAPLALDSATLLKNIQNVQSKNGILESACLIQELGVPHLDIEMETGTGKTFVYTKTIFELNKKYGYLKFIIVTPSIAIREGVASSIEDSEGYFYEQYHKKIRCLVYSSNNLQDIQTFSSNSSITVMIINTQAFNTSLKEDGKQSEQARIIYSKRDEFGSTRPIDVISQNRPIIIMDEPQKMSGEKTRNALKNFHPLFLLGYSATHTQKHNLIFRLDALDAYREKLVKKIEVKGITVHNLMGSDGYLYLNEILVSPDAPPKARIEFEKVFKKDSTPQRVKMILSAKDKNDIYALSGGMEQYKGYTITDINAFTGKVSFLNGKELSINEMQGDVAEDDLRRAQIHETIRSHFEKERENFKRGIKTLSLFFIDEVAKYRIYKDEMEQLGEYGKIFEEEYEAVFLEQREAQSNFVEDQAYLQYLDAHCSDASKAHRGYFSIDKKGRIKNSEGKSQDDISTYELILKNKRRLMSFDEDTRFIFSHSALREGWDNPNVFQICTLKHSDNTTAKRQEIGRGLRLCVDKYLRRMDSEALQDAVHDVNVLTIIASESYQAFASALQDEMLKSMSKGSKLVVEEIIQDGNQPKLVPLRLKKENFERFKSLWDKINHKYSYSVEFDSNELITNGIKAINDELYVSKPIYTVTTGIQKEEFSPDALEANDAFRITETDHRKIQAVHKTSIKYDLVGKIGKETRLTRRTIVAILEGINSDKFEMYYQNPLEFMDKVSELIIEQKSTMIVENITYNQIEGCYDSSIFTSEKINYNSQKVFCGTKAIQDYILTDGNGADNVEMKFVKELDTSRLVCTYAKMPKNGYCIPTPMGNYHPDWAIVFEKESVKHIFFVAETKGSMSSMQLKEIEKNKISCCKKLFSQMFKTEEVVFHKVDNFETLFELANLS